VQETYPTQQFTHEPVLLKECLSFLDLKPGKVVLDCTLGLGGHSSEILKAIAPGGQLYAFEKDERNLKVAKARLEAVAKESGGKFTIFHDSFSSLKDRLKREGASRVDAVLFDLGLSSPHVDDAERGFSFRKEGPLDMRFDKRQSKTAADVLNHYSEKELADVFFHLGEERSSRKLAAAVVQDRKASPFTETLPFADFVGRVLGKGKPGRHPATQIFQALRMEVNEELMALELGLNQAIELLAPHGRVVVLSYHSLEDRFVKQTFKQLATDLRDPTDLFGARVLRLKSLSLLTKKPITPSQEEITRNSRARSAVLRAVEKLPDSSI
jgi:16S rRNA (cytosine1402-N4)-methyltransferase